MLTSYARPQMIGLLVRKQHPGPRNHRAWLFNFLQIFNCINFYHACALSFRHAESYYSCFTQNAFNILVPRYKAYERIINVSILELFLRDISTRFSRIRKHLITNVPKPFLCFTPSYDYILSPSFLVKNLKSFMAHRLKRL